MILVCSFCNARYLISASLFAHGPRQVRCVRCSHKWTASVDADAVQAETVALLDVTPPPEAPAPLPPGSNLPALVKKTLPLWAERALIAVAGLLGFILLLIFVFDRQDIAKQWPFLEGFYNACGLHIYHVGEGLIIKDVRSELRYEDGIMRLVVEGKIVNETKKAQLIPAIVADAVGSDGDVMQSWQIDPPASTVAPEGVLPFSSTMSTPKGTVVEINLNFVETKNALP